MRNEDHRKLSIDAFRAYESRSIDLDIKSYRLSELGNESLISVLPEPNTVYVLRLDPDHAFAPSILGIPNRNDALHLLYIGGHESKNTGRYNALIKACRATENFFSQHGYAENDKRHGHSVAGCFTTSLLLTGFRISDCIIDVFSSAPKFDELEFIIGYEEKFHHLPPWNSIRGGASSFTYR